jgi:hypothetical protein
MNLCHRSRIDGTALERELLFEDAQFLEPRWKLKSEDVLVSFAVQLHLDFKSHWYVGASTGEILGLYKVAHAIRASCNPLQKFQGKSDRGLARTVIPDEQNGGFA